MNRSSYSNAEHSLRMYKVHVAIEKAFAHWACQLVLTEVAVHCMDATIWN
jgi:hypothetical protein